MGPFAKPLELASPLKGTVEFQPSATAPEGKSIAWYELFVDGVPQAACWKHAQREHTTGRSSGVQTNRCSFRPSTGGGKHRHQRVE